MKKIVFALSFCAFLYSCSDGISSEEGNIATKAEKNISDRDSSITRSNSYSDLFLDTAALHNFITQNKIADSIARRLKSFYNTRNFQFAWFSSNGLTEQARGFWNLHEYVTTYDSDSSLNDKKLQKRMDRLIAEDELSISASDKSYINTELRLQRRIGCLLNSFVRSNK